MSRLAVFLGAAVLAACAGGSYTGTHSLVPPTSGAAGDPISLFVPNDLGVTGSITVYSAPASGNVSPSNVIAGPSTKLGPAQAVAFDTAGNMYVSNKGVGCVTSCIAVFASGASGDAPPIRTICGDKTQLGGLIAGVAVDANGYLYVAVSPESILVFAPGANGDVAPVRVLSGQGTGLATPIGIAIDANGDLFVANETAGSTGIGSITEYAPGASGAAAPIASIAGSSTLIASPRGLALANGNIYVVNGLPGSTSVTEYAQGANGNAAPSNFIAGGNTLLAGPNGIAVDANGNVYVTNDASPAYITVYGPLIAGDVPPSQIIEGSATQLSTPGLPALH